MAAKHGNRSSRRHLKPVGSPGTAVARLRGPFLAWLVDHELPPQVDTAAVWDDVVATVDLAVERAGLTDLSRWTVEQVTTLSAVAKDADADPLPALPLLLAFLGDTGRWHGTPDDFDAVLEAAERATSPMAAVIDELAGVAVDPAAEEAALRALPIVIRTEALLRFVLPRRPVTGTGALRRADVVTAADLLGLELETRRPRSLWDVPGLASLWQAAQDAGLLVVTATEATLTPLGHGWVSGDVAQGEEARRQQVSGYLTHLLAAPPPAPWLPPPLAALLPVLAAAALDRPVPTAQLLDPTAELAELVDADRRLAPFVALSGLSAHPLLHQLQDDGLLEVTDTISAPPGLRGLLARLAATLLAGLESVAVSGSEPPAPDPKLAGQVYRLRVELVDADPPVWRDVLVDPNIPLDELHDVVQGLFAWEDCHLHEFSTVGRRRQVTRYAPVSDPSDDWGLPGDRGQDESAVRLGSLLAPRQRSELRYLYDFGDGWEHRIVVLGSEPVDGAALPRCVAGAGAAPQEDSGGVWRWSQLVESARDPLHPEHRDARDVLDLEQGQTLDPDAFDLADVEARLARLRRAAARRG